MATTDKNVWLAILLNFVWPGSGYCYMGRKFVGVFLMVVMGALAAVFFVNAGFAGLSAYSSIALVVFIVSCLDVAILHFRGKAKAMKNCPFCGEQIRTEASLCRYCHKDMVPAQ